jgi:hypothetical protein
MIFKYRIELVTDKGKVIEMHGGEIKNTAIRLFNLMHECINKLWGDDE